MLQPESFSYTIILLLIRKSYGCAEILWYNDYVWTDRCSFYNCYGDYIKYPSKPLKDFIYESNQGKDVFFVAKKEEAIQKLSHAQG